MGGAGVPRPTRQPGKARSEPVQVVHRSAAEAQRSGAACPRPEGHHKPKGGRGQAVDPPGQAVQGADAADATGRSKPVGRYAQINYGNVFPGDDRRALRRR